MNIRKIYTGLIVLLSMALFYEWTSLAKFDAYSKHLEVAEEERAKPMTDGEYVYLENDLMKVKVAITTGAIIETRLKEYGVENMPNSLGIRVFGTGENEIFRYYLKTGFTGTSPDFKLISHDGGSATLEDSNLGVIKEYSFSAATYELQIKDTHKNG